VAQFGVRNLGEASGILGFMVRTSLGAALAVILFAMAIRTSTIAKRLGRSETAWLYYGLLVPVISFVHVMILQHRSEPTSSN
jgi:hypothetical protein